MPKDIVQLNIERFRRLLAETADESRRKVIERLLAEEEAKRDAENQASRVPRSPPGSAR